MADNNHRKNQGLQNQGDQQRERTGHDQEQKPGQNKQQQSGSQASQGEERAPNRNKMGEQQGQVQQGQDRMKQGNRQGNEQGQGQDQGKGVGDENEVEDLDDVAGSPLVADDEDNVTQRNPAQQKQRGGTDQNK